MNYNETKTVLLGKGQEHLLQKYSSLSAKDQEQLLDNIGNIDFSFLNSLVKNTEKIDNNFSPVNVFTSKRIEKNKDKYEKAGLTSIEKGELGVVLLAGGQGTRLGINKPKGTFNIGETRELYIFQLLIENLLQVTKKAKTFIHLFIMTNINNNQDTKTFFSDHDYFGYSKEHMHFFVQEMLPSTDKSGKILMSSPTTICLSPNGNGGWFSSLKKTPFYDELLKDGIKWINVVSVDNVLQKLADPLFLGAILCEGYSSGGKVIEKCNPDERVGVLCCKNGKPYIIEYYELSKEMKDARLSDGEPAYNYGVILNYIFPVKILDEAINSNMPLHVVEKIVPYMDENGNYIKPSSPNGYKFETLALDMVKQMPDCLAYEVIREKEFAPVKNATGVDSVESARQLLKQNNFKL